MIDFVSKPLTNSVAVVEVSGRLTELNRQYFFDCVTDMIASGYKHIIIECDKLGSLNSGGLAALLTARKRAVKNGGKIHFTHLNSSIAYLIEITKLGRILSVYPTTGEALSSLEDELASIA